MTILEFKIDERGFREDIDASPQSASQAELLHTYFHCSVRLCINTIELLELDDDPWRELPVIHVATIGSSKVRRFDDGCRAVYELQQRRMLPLSPRQRLAAGWHQATKVPHVAFEQQGDALQTDDEDTVSRRSEPLAAQ
jgi:hypothetical protein